MLPGGLVAAAFLLSLIPGWWFLHRTESIRRPRELSPLKEVLELVAVGVLTTGTVAVVGLAVWPGLISKHDWRPVDEGDVRLALLITVVWMAVAVLLAEVAAHASRFLNPTPGAEINNGVWWSILRPEKVPAGHLSYVALTLEDGSMVEGILDTYTWTADVAHRDIALREPIKFTQLRAGPAGEIVASAPQKAPYDRLIVPASQIRHVALKYAQNGTARETADQAHANAHALLWFSFASVVGALAAGFGRFLVPGDANRELAFGIFSVCFAMVAGLRGMQRFAARSPKPRGLLHLLETAAEWAVTSSVAGPLIVGFGTGTGLTAGLLFVIPHIAG